VTRDGHRGTTDVDGPLPDDLQWVLADRYRRRALAFLSERDTATTTEIATALARSGVDADVDRIRVSFERHHVPVMTDAGVLEFTDDDETVALADLPESAREQIDRATAQLDGTSR
jgi:hypothetical protein